MADKDSADTMDAPATEEKTPSTLNIKAVLNEFIAMMFFVIIGCGSAMGSAHDPGWVGLVSAVFGLAITALACATGAQINCAVTFGLCILGELSPVQTALNFVSQILGSCVGAVLLHIIYDDANGIAAGTKDKTGGLGSNGVSEAMACWQVLIGEIFFTFLLMFVVCRTVLVGNDKIAEIAIGLTVFLAHTVLIPMDGCSINPTRSTGPAIVAFATGRNKNVFGEMWVFWLGPIVGASLAAVAHRLTS